MVHRPGQSPQPAHIPEQYHVYAVLPPMRSIRNAKFKGDICERHVMPLVPVIENLIQQDGLAGKIELNTSMANLGVIILNKCPQDFADKVKTLPGVKSVDPAPAYYPMKRPSPGLRSGPQ